MLHRQMHTQKQIDTDVIRTGSDNSNNNNKNTDRLQHRNPPTQTLSDNNNNNNNNTDRKTHRPRQISTQNYTDRHSTDEETHTQRQRLTQKHTDIDRHKNAPTQIDTDKKTAISTSAQTDTDT